MMETGSDQTADAGDSPRRPREQYERNEPADWPNDPSGSGNYGQQRRDGYRQRRPEAYREQPDGYGQQQPDGYRQQQPDGYRQERSDGYDQRPGGYDQRRPDGYGQQRPDGYRGRHSPTAATPDGQRQAGRPQGQGAGPYRLAEPPVARRTPTGWRVGDEEVSDLTSAMVLADLLATDLPAEGPPTPGGPAASAAAKRRAEEPPPNVRQLQETVAQLEHALTVRVRVEQAIGVLAERHRLRPRQAFELLRSAARTRGRRVLEVAGEVVESASNPLLRLPEELAKPPVARRRGRTARRPHADG
jgi:ANTAR domain